jgi:hypothetical protein
MFSAARGAGVRPGLASACGRVENGGVKEDVDRWICPECGAEVKVGASGCPHCLKKRRKTKKAKRRAKKPPRSWEQDPEADGLGVADDDFDYDAFLEREFGRSPHRRVGIPQFWWWTALALLVALVVAVFAGGLLRWL